MQLTESAKKTPTTFDDCIFVCTPNQVSACGPAAQLVPILRTCYVVFIRATCACCLSQGTFPKCPFGACCTAEDRSDECATCNSLWCKPTDINCPFHPAHPEHARYCGVPDVVYTNFLKMLRSRVVVASHVVERQNEDFAKLQETVKIKANAHRMLQQAYRNYEYSNLLRGDLGYCVPIESKIPKMKGKMKSVLAIWKNRCRKCVVDPRSGCVGKAQKKATKKSNKDHAICGHFCVPRRKLVQKQLNKMNRDLMKEQFKEVRDFFLGSVA